MRKAQAALIDALQFCAERRIFQISPESISKTLPDTSAIDAKIKADQRRLQRAKEIFKPEVAEKDGIKLIFVNTSDKDEHQLNASTPMDVTPFPMVTEVREEHP